MAQTKKRSLNNMLDQCIQILLHPTGLLSLSPVLILLTGKESSYQLPIQQQEDDNQYFTVLKDRSNKSADNVIGGLKQSDGGRITGKINLSHLSDNVNTCIVVDTAHLDNTLFLQHVKPKAKFDPKRSEFITQKEFNNETDN